MGSDSLNSDDSLFSEISDALRSRSKPATIELYAEQTSPLFIEGFQVIGEIHRGGQGIVYEANQLIPSRRVAIKVLLHGAFSSERQRFRFEREIELVAALNHPNIVTIHQSGFVAGQPYFVMEYIDGVPINDFEKHVPSSRDKFRSAISRIRTVCHLMKFVCSAVTCLQQHGLIHRDLKPDNILVDRDGQPHIIDFGLARRLDAANDATSWLQTQTGEFMGTLAYAAPEQLSSKPAGVDSRCDVYALGAILYELLTGTTPHDCRDSVAISIQRICNEIPKLPREFNSSISRDLEVIVMTALARDPERRYQTADLLASDLGRYLQGLPIEARRDSLVYVLSSTIRRHRMAFVGAAAFVIMLITSSLVSLVLWRQAEDRLERAIVAEERTVLARDEEKRQRTEAEFHSYTASVAAAISATRSFQIQDAYDHLHRVVPHLRDFEWYYALSRIDTSIETWKTHTTGLTVMSFSSDGSMLAVGGISGIVKVLDRNSGKERLTLDDVGRVTTLAFHPVDRILVIGFEDGTLREFDIAANEWRRDLRPLPAMVNDIEFDPDGTRMIACCGRSDITIHQLEIRDYVTDDVIASDSQWFNSLSCTSDGKLVAAVGEVVSLFDLQAGTCIRTSQVAGGPSLHCQFTADGRFLVHSMSDQAVAVLDGKTLAEQRRFAVEQHVTGIAVHPESQWIATCASDGTIRSWDFETGEPNAVQWGHLGAAVCVAYTEDGSRLISLDQRGEIKHWMADADPSDFSVEAHLSTVNDICFNSSGTVIATSSYSARIKLWDVVMGREIRTLNGHSASVNSIAFSPDCKSLVSGSSDRTMRIWNLDTGKSTAISGNDGEVLSVAYSPDGKMIASAAMGGSVRLWDARTRKQLSQFHSDEINPVRWVQFSQDGQWLIAERPTEIKVWNVSRGIIEHNFEKTRNTWYAAATLHPKLNRIAVGDDSGRIQIWDLTNGSLVSTIQWHATSISAISFNSTGTRMVAASTDGAVKIWHVDRCEELLSLPSNRVPIHCLKFSPDGKSIAAGYHDGRMMWWEALESSRRLRRNSGL